MLLDTWHQAVRNVQTVRLSTLTMHQEHNLKIARHALEVFCNGSYFVIPPKYLIVKITSRTLTAAPIKQC